MEDRRSDHDILEAAAVAARAALDGDAGNGAGAAPPADEPRLDDGHGGDGGDGGDGGGRDHDCGGDHAADGWDGNPSGLGDHEPPPEGWEFAGDDGRDAPAEADPHWPGARDEGRPPPLPVTPASRPPARPLRAMYDEPSLRPCRKIEPERDEVVRLRIQDAYAALTEDLPLAGGRSMAPCAGGGIRVVERIREELPWMDAATGLLERQLRVALWAGRPWMAFRPMCLVGPPGSGKSHFARELGRLSGVPHDVLDMGSMHDSAALVATSRGWTNAKPCWPAERMAARRCANPLLVLDEIEKAGGSRRNGDPLVAMLGMLEPSSARAYHDTCLLADVDLSAVCWIMTANDASRIPAPLASRLDMVEVTPPGPAHFDGLLSRLLAATAVEWGVTAAALPDLPTRAVSTLRSGFAARRSVRWLRRGLHDVLAALVGGPRVDLN